MIENDYGEGGIGLSPGTKRAILLARAKCTSRIEEYQLAMEAADGSFILWKLDLWFSLMNDASNDAIAGIFDSYMGIDSLWKLSQDIQVLINALRGEDANIGSAVSEAHSFFGLVICPLDPGLVLTSVVTNWRLRTSMKLKGMSLSPSPLASTELVKAIDKEQTNDLLSIYCCHHAIDLFNLLQEYLGSAFQNDRFSTKHVKRTLEMLQYRIFLFQ